MYGTQARKSCDLFIHSFENDVKMYGTQAAIARRQIWTLFENDVKMYGTQAQKTKVSCIW